MSLLPETSRIRRQVELPLSNLLCNVKSYEEKRGIPKQNGNHQVIFHAHDLKSKTANKA